MAEVVERLKFEADIADIKTALQEIQAGLQETENKAAEHGVVYKKMFELVQTGARAVIDFYREGIQSAIEYETATLRLGAALEATGQGRERTAELQEQAAALENLTGIEEEHILAVQKTALNYGVTVDNMDRTMKAAASLAAVTGQDLNSALMSLAHIQETGVVPRTMRAMDAFKDLTKEQLQQLDVVDLINEKLGSQMTTAMEGAEGAIFRLKDAFGDWGRELSTGVVPYLTTVLDKVTIIAKFMGSGGLGEYLASAVYGTDISPEFLVMGQQARGEIPMSAGGTPTATRTKESGKAFGKGGSKNRAGESSDLKWGFANDGADDLVMTPDGTIMPKAEYEDMLASAQKSIKDLDRIEAEDEKVRQKNRDLQLGFEKRYQEGLTEIADTNAQRRAELAEYEASAVTTVYENMRTLGTSAFTSLSNAALGALETLASGQPAVLEKIAGDFLKTIGHQVFQRGAVDELEGLRRVAFSYGTDATGYELMGIGAAEMGLGAALSAGRAKMSSKATAKTSGASTSAGGGSSTAYAGGSVSTTSPGSQGPSIINININGPSLNSPQMGVAIRDALNAAVKAGV